MEEELREIVAKVMKLPLEKVTQEADLFNELGVDSLMAVEILASIDKKYGIDIPEEKLKDVKTVRDIVSLIEKLV